MKEVSNKMQRYVAEYKKYHDYLERVVNETGEFQSINEIFNRYETLVEARQSLSDRQDRNLKLLEEKGTEIVRFIVCYIRLIKARFYEVSHNYGRRVLLKYRLVIEAASFDQNFCAPAFTVRIIQSTFTHNFSQSGQLFIAFVARVSTRTFYANF